MLLEVTGGRPSAQELQGVARMNGLGSGAGQASLTFGEAIGLSGNLALDGHELVAAAVTLGALEVGGPLSTAESQLVEQSSSRVEDRTTLRQLIFEGDDPLGDALCGSLGPRDRRERGVVYTPPAIVEAMVNWVLEAEPARVIDAGCGSGRFAAEIARRCPDLELVCVDTDPRATLACRAALSVHGAHRAHVVNEDFARLELPVCQGRTAFLGNPPYVRHHQLSMQQKRWAKGAAAALGLASWSGLSGLHMHFFLSAFRNGRRGDIGCFVTSSEWLDVLYGQPIRSALANGAGVVGIHLLDPQARPFHDAMTTAVVTCFEIDSPTRRVRVRKLSAADELGDLSRAGRPVSRRSLAEAARWGGIVRGERERAPSGRVRLGDYVRVSRGAVTGANSFFVLDRMEAARLGLAEYTKPVLSQAAQVLRSDGVVRQDATTKVLLDPDPTTDLSLTQHEPLRRYLHLGAKAGIVEGYVCAHRSPWWRVGAKQPPVVATYMARQAPAFAINPEGLSILNVLHGLYPRVPLSSEHLLGLVNYLNLRRTDLVGTGRTYQGGLEKLEPREMEQAWVPPCDQLPRWAAT